MLLSLFCGAGGLDHGFEEAGFKIGLALDKKADSVASYNLNRPTSAVAKEFDLSRVTAADLDELYGKEFRPRGVIGGPPCQSFSQANVRQRADDVRTTLPTAYARLVTELHRRSPLDFFVMENVVGLTSKKHVSKLEAIEETLRTAGFKVGRLLVNAKNHGVPQSRPRLFVVGLNKAVFADVDPGDLILQTMPEQTVRQTIGNLGEPARFSRGLDMSNHEVHPNHWCMNPRSPKFSRKGGVRPGVAGRSFKMLDWESPSITVAYGHREVHVHPSGRRRLSVYEAMLLQSFPRDYVLVGSLSSQIDQVSEAVPPPLAKAVATSIAEVLAGYAKANAA